MPVKVVCKALKTDYKDITEIFPSDPHPSHIGLSVVPGMVIFKGKDHSFGLPADVYHWTIQTMSKQDVAESSGRANGNTLGYAMLTRDEAEFAVTLCEVYSTDMAPFAVISENASPEARHHAIEAARLIEQSDRLERVFRRIVERLPKDGTTKLPETGE